MSVEQQPIEYRDIPQCLGYRAGSDGTIWSCRPINGRGPLKSEWRQLKPTIDSKGRAVVSICSGDKRRQLQVHTLVLMAFVGPKPAGMQCRHYPDPNPLNCSVGNLQWGTQKQNAEDSIIQGIQIRGEKCHKSKLTADQVIEIRKLYTGKRGEFTSLALKYGIDRGNISGIVFGKTWKHVIPSRAVVLSQYPPQEPESTPSPTELPM